MAVSPWLDQDNTGNVLVISGDRSFIAENPVNFQSAPDWFFDVVVDAGIARTGDYRAFQVSGGAAVSGAKACCFAHAAAGDVDTQSWNFATTGTDPTDPVCRLVPQMGTGGASFADNPSFVIEFNSDPPGGGFTGAFARASVVTCAEGVWLSELRKNLTPTGALDVPDPVADGYPVDSFIEYEADKPDLVKVEVAVDVAAVPAFPYTDTMTISINDFVRPTWADAAFDEWYLGTPPKFPLVAELMADGVTPKSYLVLDEDPMMPYAEYPGLDDWSKCFDKDAGQEPDFLATRHTSSAFYGDPHALTNAGSGYHVAVRVTLHNPRYRWVYGDLTVGTSFRRFRGRKDHYAGGAERFWPQPTTEQHGRFGGDIR